MPRRKDLSIYIHIPFCVRKCRYCDFLSFPADENTYDKYIEVLISEIMEKAPLYREYSVVSVFFGGGTPSVINPLLIAKVMDLLKDNFSFFTDAEISIEVNPGTVEGADKDEVQNAFEIYRKAGINRVSIGLQSAEDEELKMLGRIHDRASFARTYNKCRLAGFDNVNVDLISAIPGQSVENYRKSLEYVCGLKPKPEHISAYSLILEEGTWFYEHRNELDFVSEDADRQMYELTDSFLRKNGYHRYEISNYALKGHECRHNKVYWQRGNYLGLGLGSSSMVDNIRWKNTDIMDEYMSGMFGRIDEEKLPVSEQMEEFMYLGLRMCEGVSKSYFYECFGKKTEDVYGAVLCKLKEENLITEEGDRIALTGYGLDVSNYVFEKFIIS